MSRWRMYCGKSAGRKYRGSSVLAAFLALPSVILMMMFGQTRVFFSMARDRSVARRADQNSPAIPHAPCGDA